MEINEQDRRDKVIKELECCISLNHNGSKCANCDYADEFHNGDCETYLLSDALALLKEHEKATIEPKRIDLSDKTKAWLDKMDAVDALGNIVDICMDWDGYRTANGLGGLINEIWAYARYCAGRLQKAQEPVEPYRDSEGTCFCGACMEMAVGYKNMNTGKDVRLQKYCSECGRKVKWDG